VNTNFLDNVIKRGRRQILLSLIITEGYIQGSSLHWIDPYPKGNGVGYEKNEEVNK
jgi:hypothetical protein